MSRSVPLPLIADEPTGPYQPSEATGASFPRIQVARTHEARPGTITDVRALLHKRLRFLATLLFGATAAVLTITAVTLLLTNQGRITEDSGPDFLVSVLILALPGALAGVLWKCPSLSLSRLRVLELILFGVLFAHWTWMHASRYPQYRLDHPPIWFSSIMAHAVSVPWVFMIVLYGIFIPNTGWRCAAVVSVMALAPLVISIVSGLAAHASEGHSQVTFLIVVAVWMALAAAIATYGSNRIEVLRQEVLTTRRLGPYQIRRRLGSGGMGEVYLADHILLRRPCAVKLIRPDRTSDATSLLRFEREVQAMATLTHPNTVQIFDYGHTEDNTFYYAMEYLPGLNLEEIVERHGPLPPERACYLLSQVCSALHEAHALGLIHRDIKPSNIIACQRGGTQDVAKLLDFGLVRAHSDRNGAKHLTQEGSIAGTPAYMSPEQADDKQNLDFRSDIYSLGAVAYFLLTGQPPFVRSTPLQTLLAHLHDPPVPLDQLRPDMPTDLQGVVLRCLEKDPARRFPDAHALQLALAACRKLNPWTEESAADWWRGQTASERETRAIVGA